MAIKKAARKVARRAVSEVKRAAKGGSRKRVVRKSSKKVKRVTRGRPRKNSQKKLTSKKKKVSKKSRVTRKRRRSAKKTTSSRKRRARKPSTKRRRRKQKTEEVVAVDKEETASEETVAVDEVKAEASVEGSTTENDSDSVSLEAPLEAQENVAPKEEREVVESDSVSGIEIQADKFFEESAEDVQTPGQESLPDSREPETESREPVRVHPGTQFESTERESEPESDYVIVTKEDAEKCSEVGATEVTEETSVVEEEPVLGNYNQKDTEAIRTVESDEDVRRWQEEEAETQHDDSSSLPSFGVRDVPASSEVNTSTSAVPMM